ncbi:hypothetical protein, partial [Pseudonocardia pini]|uniref:hypothetical protein n=1 Tax=Pseudonocardia pini TaxID=2758030 RepID=UPI001C68928B
MTELDTLSGEIPSEPLTCWTVTDPGPSPAEPASGPWGDGPTGASPPVLTGLGADVLSEPAVVVTGGAPPSS